MRPWVALVITFLSVVAWWELRQLAPGWALFGFILTGFALVLLAPIVVGALLLRRRRLGQWTSVWFVVQALSLVAASLVLPDFDDVKQTAPIAVLFGQPEISEQGASALTMLGLLFAVVWLVLIPVTAVLAFTREKAEVPPVG